jgi:hypothetical protein
MNPHLEMVRGGADERRRPLEGYVDPGHGASSKYSYLVKALILYSGAVDRQVAGRESIE